MQYTVEESLQDFKAWSGGKDTLDDLWAHNVVDKAEEYINMVTAGQGELLTQTEINKYTSIAEYMTKCIIILINLGKDL